MNGAPGSQTVWGTHLGNLGQFSLSSLRSEYLIGRLPEYQVYVFRGPDEPCTLVTPSAVLPIGSADCMRLTCESGESIVIPCSGLMYDYAEWYPYHLTINHPGNARYFVGYYGNKQPDIKRRIVKWEYVGSQSILILPLSSFLTGAYAAVLSDYEQMSN